MFRPNISVLMWYWLPFVHMYLLWEMVMWTWGPHLAESIYYHLQLFLLLHKICLLTATRPLRSGREYSGQLRGQCYAHQKYLFPQYHCCGLLGEGGQSLKSACSESRRPSRTLAVVLEWPSRPLAGVWVGLLWAWVVLHVSWLMQVLWEAVTVMT